MYLLCSFFNCFFSRSRTSLKNFVQNPLRLYNNKNGVRSYFFTVDISLYSFFIFGKLRKSLIYNVIEICNFIFLIINLLIGFHFFFGFGIFAFSVFKGGWLAGNTMFF